MGKGRKRVGSVVGVGGSVERNVDGAGSERFLIVLQQKDLEPHIGLVNDSKLRVCGFAFGFCRPPRFLRTIKCTNTMRFISTSSSKHRCQNNFVFSRAQHAKQVLITQMVWSGSFQCRTFKKTKEGVHSQHPTDPKHNAQTEVSTDKITILMRWINKPGLSQSD